MGSSGAERLGLLAGSGRLPVLVAGSARSRGWEVVVFGFKGMMSPELKDLSAGFHEVPFCNLGALVARLEDEGISKAVTIGGITQTSVIGGLPQFDELAFEIWRSLPDRRVDTIMRMLVGEIEKRGVQVMRAVDFLEEHFAPRGVMTSRRPSSREWRDIKFGFDMAKAIGGMDIGQTVVVKQMAVMAAEAVEGTNEAILRGGGLARGGAVVVKVAKPGQDMRFDVPAAGSETIETMRRTGAAVLALETGMVLMVDGGEMRKLAERSGICMVGVTGQEVEGDE